MLELKHGFKFVEDKCRGRMNCMRACPTHAIHFGNLRDKTSVVAKAGSEAVRGYHSLEELNTRPAVTYLAKVQRGTVEG